MTNIDLRNHNEIIDAINAIINNRGIAEIKKEEWKSGEKITVVEQHRSVKLVFPPEKIK